MFSVGDEIIITNDDNYSITRIDSIGIIGRITSRDAEVTFTYLTSSYKLPCTFTIALAHMQHYSSDPTITPIIRKIRQMEKHFASRHDSI